MKKLILLLSISALFSLYCQAQEELDFKIQYKPDTKYTRNTEEITSNERSYFGNDDFLLKLKHEQVENPTVANSVFKMESILKTGISTDDTILATIEYGKITSFYLEPVIPSQMYVGIANSPSDYGKKNIAEGTIISGRILPKKRFELDSIYLHGRTEFGTKAILTTIDSVFWQPALPERKWKVGEKISLDTIATIRMVGAIFDMKSISTYTLVDIIDGIGNFDVLKEYSLKNPISQYVITITGTGNGQIQYNIANNFFEKYTINTETEMDLKMDDWEINDKFKGSYSSITEMIKQ